MIPEIPMQSRTDEITIEGLTSHEVEQPLDVRPFVDPAPGQDSMQLPSDRMVGLRFLKSSLGRQRKWWLGIGALGLIVGGLYHVVVPMKYAATTTVYLVHPANASSATGPAQDDLAMLDTDAVAKKALARLHERGLTAAGLLGKAPGTLLAQNLLQIIVYGPSPSEAIKRVNALTKAYLSFRDGEYAAQNRAVVAAADAQLSKLATEVTKLSSEIAATATNPDGQLATLDSERAAALYQLTALKAAIQQDNVSQLAVTHGTNELSSGTVITASRKKVLALDGLTGLAAGLGASLLVLAVAALISDRARRREDVAAVLGAPVALSVGRIGRRWWPRRSMMAMAARPDRELSKLIGYLRAELVATKRRTTELVVAVDDPDVPAAALIALASALTEEGTKVALVDATQRRCLAHAFRLDAVGLHSVDPGHGLATLTLVVAPLPGDGADPAVSTAAMEGVPSAKVVLVLASTDPAVGASHLRPCSRDAILFVSAGRSKVQQIAAAAELLGAAGIAVRSAVLVDADRSDDSVGLPRFDSPPARRAVGASGLSRATR